MFNDVVLLHGGGNANVSPGSAVSGERNVCSSEKMTQTGDGNVWSTPQSTLQVGLIKYNFLYHIL